MTTRSYAVRLEANVAGFVAQVGVQAVNAVTKLEAAASSAGRKIDDLGDRASHVGPKLDAGIASVYPLGDTTAAELMEDAIIHVQRFWEHGPELDGWGAWRVPDFAGTYYQLLTREVVLDDLSFLNKVVDSSPDQQSTPGQVG